MEEIKEKTAVSAAVCGKHRGTVGVVIRLAPCVAESLNGTPLLPVF